MVYSQFWLDLPQDESPVWLPKKKEKEKSIVFYN
jgi:hypothetical protein